MVRQKSTENHLNQYQNLSVSIGRKGESLASDYLVNRGYKILERNLRGRDWEIDIIAKKNGIFVFLEVKFRKNKDFGTPEKFVDNKKRHRIIKGAMDYLVKKRLWNKVDVRFDVITIIKGKEVIHYKNAFKLEKN